jgi:flagellar FliL protein
MPPVSKDAPEEAPVKKRGFLGKLLRGILYLLGAGVLAAAGFAAGFVYFANPLSPEKGVLSLIEEAAPAADATAADEHAAAEDPEAPHKVPKETPEEEQFVTSYYTFEEPMTSNLAGGRRILQVSIGLSTQYDAKVFEHVEANKVALKSDMLAVASTFGEADLANKEGRQKLADALKEAINNRLEQIEGFGGIDAVFFPSFILQ